MLRIHVAVVAALGAFATTACAGLRPDERASVASAGPTVGASSEPRTRDDDASSSRDTGSEPLDTPAWSAQLVRRCRRVEPLAREAAADHALDVGLVMGIVRVESSFRADAKSPAGAVGLMQVMPSNRSRFDCGDLWEPRANLTCGLRILEAFLEAYDGRLIYALSGYNAGHRPPDRAREARVLPSNVDYVERVLRARSAYLRGACER